jgi:tripeptidyl-peptidase-1
MFAPEEKTVINIMNWLTSFGIHGSRIVHSENKGWIAADVTVEEAESLLLAEFYEHEHKYSPKVRVGCDKYKIPFTFRDILLKYTRYHVPEHLQPHIDYITPGIKLTPVVKRTVKAKRGTPYAVKAPIHVEIEESQIISAEAAALPPVLQNCSTNITPACLKALYGIPDAPAAVPGNSVGLYQQGSYFAKEDIDAYMAKYAPYVPQGTYPINASIDGASYSVPPASALNTGEANIDIDMTLVIHESVNFAILITDEIQYFSALSSDGRTLPNRRRHL